MKTLSFSTRIFRSVIAISLAVAQAAPSAHAGDAVATPKKSAASQSVVSRVRVKLFGASEKATSETTATSLAISLAEEMETAKNLEDVATVIEKVSKAQLTMNERLVIYDRTPSEILTTREKYEAAAANVADFSDLPYLAELLYVISLDSKIQSSNMLGLRKYRLQRSLRAHFAESLNSWHSGVSLQWSQWWSRQSSQAQWTNKPSETETSPLASSSKPLNIDERVLGLSKALLAGMDEQDLQQIAKNQKAWSELVRSEMKENLSGVKKESWMFVSLPYQSQPQTNPTRGLGNAHFLLGIGSLWSILSPFAAMDLVINGNISDVSLLGFGGLVCAIILGVDVTKQVREQNAPKREAKAQALANWRNQKASVRSAAKLKEAALDTLFTQARENRARYQCIGALSGSANLSAK